MNQKPALEQCVSIFKAIQCYDTVDWVAGRASGL